MPVVVTGASGLIGRAAVRTFATRSPEVRAYVRRKDAVEGLRGLGAKVAVGNVEDVDTLAVVMLGAHTVCHLVGALDLPDAAAYERVNLQSTRAVIEAARGAGVPRVLFLSSPGASAASSNDYLRTKGLAEDAVRSSGLEHAVLRCTHVYGPASPWLAQARALARSRPAIVFGSGRQVIAPVFVEDVSAVLAAADDREQSTKGTWGLEGPDRVDADEFSELLAGSSRRKLHASGPKALRAAGRTGRRISVQALEILESDSLSDAPDAAAEFGVGRTSLREGLARSTA